jgi:hypothetical protein
MKALSIHLLVICIASSAWARQPSESEAAAYASAPILLIGKVVNARQGPTAMSHPPIYSVQLTIKVSQALRGDVAIDKDVSLFYRQHGGQQPQFEKNQQVVVVASRIHRVGSQARLSAQMVFTPDDQELKAIKRIGSLPIGWTIADGKPLSPWAQVDGYRWPAKVDQDACSKTARPPLKAPGIAFKVEPVIIPEHQKKWTNPDGDGLFKITVTNPTDKPLTVPALLQLEGEIQWDQSMLLLYPRDQVTTLPGAAKLSKPLAPVVLQPGQSVSTTINVLKIQGPQWPRGGSRLTFTFALGEHGSTHSFYYLSRHHDRLRQTQ